MPQGRLKKTSAVEGKRPHLYRNEAIRCLAGRLGSQGYRLGWILLGLQKSLVHRTLAIARVRSGGISRLRCLGCFSIATAAYRFRGIGHRLLRITGT